MLLDLAEHDVGQDLAAASPRPARRRRGGLVAARLDAENADHSPRSFHDCPARWHFPVRRCGKAGRLAAVGYHGPRAMQTTAFRIGTRGSPLALAQAHETRARLMAAHGLPEEAFEIEVDLDQRRPHPGPAAVGGRRQGPVHQGDRGGAARRPHRHRRAFVQGHADAAAGRPGALRLPAARGCARRLHRPGGAARSPTCRTARSSARRRCAGRR